MMRFRNPMRTFSGVKAMQTSAAAFALAVGLSTSPAFAQDGQSEEPQSDAFAQANAAEAQRILMEANAAYEASEWVRAAALFTQVSVMPLAEYLSEEELTQAEQRLADARVRGGLSRSGPATGEAELNTVAYQRVLAEVNSLMDRSRDILGAGDPDRAKDVQSRALTRWENAFRRGVMGEAQYDALRRELEALDEQIRSTRTRLIQDQERVESERLGREAMARERDAENRRRNRVEQSLVRLASLQEESRYEEALSVIDEVLFIDPVNPTALLMRKVIEDILVYKEFRDAERASELSIARNRAEFRSARRIPTDIMEFPDDWEPISERRTTEFAALYSDSPENLAVNQRLVEVRMPGQFDRTNFEDVLRFVSSVANVNIDPDWEAMNDLGVERDTEVTLDIGEKSARTVLERVLAKVSGDPDFPDDAIDYAIQDGVIVVAPELSLAEDAYLIIYDVKDLVRPLIDFNTAPDLSLDQILGGQGGGSPFEEDDDDDEPFDERDPDDDGGPVQNRIDQLEEIIRVTVGENKWYEDTFVEVFNQNFLIKQTARNHREIRNLLTQLRDVQSIQITVETRILEISQDFFEKIGFDVDVTFNAIDNGRVALANEQYFSTAANGTLNNGTLLPRFSTLDPFAVSSAQGGTNLLPPAFQNFDNGTPLDPTDDFIGIANQNVLVPGQELGRFGPIQANQSDGFSGENNLTGLFSTPLAGAFLSNPAFSLTGQFFDDVQVDFLIEATQADNRSTLLTAPQLTFTNGHQASLFVGGNVSAVTGVNSVTNAGAVAFDPVVTPIPFGVSIVVEGFVSADRRFVTLLLDLQIATAPTFETATTSAAVAVDDNNDDGDSNTPDGIVSAGFSLPSQNANLIRTSVTVPDKGTLLLGGQRVSTEVEVESGVPVLSSIPVLNRFFTNRTTEQSDSTLLVLVKPTVIIMGQEEERNFPGLQDRLNRNIDF